jgi:hypothetical protein
MSLTTTVQISDAARKTTMTRADRPTTMTDRTMAMFKNTLIALTIGYAALMANGSTADAALQFPAIGEISGPTATTPFAGLRSESVAVNDANGHILVADSGTGLVYDFASAADTSPTTWDGSTTPAGSFGGGRVAVAVDNASGDVYVADSTHAVIDKFTSAGALVTTFGDTTPAADGQLAGSATPAASFSAASSGSLGIAVDQSNQRLYVIDAGHQVVDVFAASGAYLSQISDTAAATAGLYGGGGAYADGVAVNATSGHVFVSDSYAVQTFEFDASGSFVATWTGANTPAGSFGGNYTSVAVENSSGDVYVTDAANAVVDAFDSAGAYLGRVTGAPTGADGVAIGQSTGRIYVADSGTGSVKIFAAGIVAADATTDPATAVGPASATVNGHLDPAGAGATTDCHFDYVDGTAFQSTGFAGAQTAACAEGNAFSSASDVHAAISGLTPETTYHARLSVANANGTNAATEVTFTTPSAVQITTGQASDRSQSTATLNGTLDPGGLPVTSCQFEYGSDTSYGTSVPCTESLATIGAGITDTSVTTHLSGLQTGSLYHYRLRASNGLGTTIGQDQTFVTRGPGFGIKNFSFQVLDRNGHPYTQAGGHPYEIKTDIDFNLTTRQDGLIVPDQLVKDLNVSLPSGLIGNPTAASQCSISVLQQFTHIVGQAKDCPASSQVGTLDLDTEHDFFGFIPKIPIYNMVPQAGLPAQFGFNYAQVVSVIDNTVRTGSDYGLDSGLSNIASALPVLSSKLTLWGVPSDPSHNGDRHCFYYAPLGCASSGDLRPLFTNPTSCSGPQTVTARADSWQNRGQYVTKTDTLPALTGCDKLQFKPSLSLQPDTSAADSPSGLDVDMRVPQDGLKDPSGLGSAHLRKAVVTLPAGFSLNPAAADGLNACSAAQVGLNDASEPRCPDASKVGTAKITTPLLADPLEGSLYLARQDDNPFHTLLSGYLVAEGSGVLIKLPGRFDADPATGQLTATFDNNPQQPFTDLKLHFFGGAHGVLATPQTCGTFTTTASLTPWSAPDSGAPVSLSDPFAITSGPNGTGCVSDLGQRPLNPGFSAGTSNSQAGAYSPFVLRLTRSDGEQNISRVDTTLPPGLLGKLAGVTQCSDAALVSISAAQGTGQGELANPACPANSLVGSTSVGSGVGPSPFYVSGKAYLAGPYKGAPFSLALVTPAVAGPLDLGTVVVRAGLYIDPITAQVTVKSDPIPTIVDGIPLRIRDIRVNTDRPGFTLNPTSCDPMAVTGQVVGSDGATPTVSSRFQAGGCQALGLSPKLAIALTGKGQTTDDKHPGVHATVSQTGGQANLKKVTVSLPLSLALDPDNAQALCEFADGSKIDPVCPKGSIVGQATARTPILDQPLTGPVYFVKNIRKDPKSGREIRTLPKLVIPLTGQNGIRLNLVGTSNVVDNHLVTTFDNIPDAPVSDFTLDIAGGKSGILVVSGTDICKASQVATQQINGQNAKQLNANVYLQTPACPLKIISKKTGKTTVAIKIGGLGAGKVTVRGTGIKKTTKTITQSTVATITAKRTNGKPGKVTVSFDPAGPAKAHKTTK